MKRYKLLILLMLLMGGAFNSCNKSTSTGDVSRITYFPEFEYNGDEVVLLEQGTSWTDPGVTATESGEEIPVEKKVSGAFTSFTGADVDTSTPDLYNITYSATNADGFVGNKYRDVWVYSNGDFADDISGLYIADTPQATGIMYVLIWKESDNTYGISDALMGNYHIGRAYGLAYAATGGTITVNNLGANDITLTGAYNPGFGTTVTISNIQVNTSTRTISWNAYLDAYEYDFGGGIFTMTQVQ